MVKYSYYILFSLFFISCSIKDPNSEANDKKIQEIEKRIIDYKEFTTDKYNLQKDQIDELKKEVNLLRERLDNKK